MSAETKKLKKHPVRDAVVIVIAVLTVIFAVYITAVRISGRIPFVFNYTIGRIITPSMEPVIMTGDCILIKKVSPEAVKVNDIIMFYSDDPAILGKPNTHRVMEIIKKTDGTYEFVTRGDHNNGVNDSVTAKSKKLIGIYVSGLPVLSAIMQFLTKKWAFPILIVVPAVIIFLISLKDVGKKAKEAKMDQLVQDEVQRMKEAENHKNDSGNGTGKED